MGNFVNMSIFSIFLYNKIYKSTDFWLLFFYVGGHYAKHGVGVYWLNYLSTGIQAIVIKTDYREFITIN